MRPFLFPVIMLIFCSCGDMRPAEENPIPKDTSGISNDSGTAAARRKYTFFDSLQHGIELTSDQMLQHMPDLASAGSFVASSTLFPAEKSYAIVILNEDDHLVCSNKYLVVLDKATAIATDSKLVQADCDVDYGHTTTDFSYQLLNDSMFQLTEVSYLAVEADSAVPKDSTITTWKISPQGKMIKQQAIGR